MKFRWTTKELQKITPQNPEEIKKFIICVLHDRKDSLTNVYSPLYQTLSNVQKWVENNAEFKFE